MELHTIRGGSETELEARKYNIGIGVSLGNKWFTPENILESVRWALPRTRESVVVYVADTIHGINLAVRSRISDERALKIAIRYGQELMDRVRAEIEKQFTIEEQKRIAYATWAGITTPAYQQKVRYLYQLYESDTGFRDCIQGIVRRWVSKEARAFTDDEISKFGTYILEELPEVMGRVPMNGILYEAYTYPFDGALTQLVEKLQTGEVFPEVKARVLDTEPKVFLELR